VVHIDAAECVVVTEKRFERFSVSAQHATLTVWDGEGTVNISIRGEYDLSCAEASERILEQVGELVADTQRGIVVDLTDTTFLDAAGIKFILRLEQVGQLASGSITTTVRCADRHVRHIFELVDLKRLLEPEFD
jgi:anti-anti-sigma factor